MLIDRLLKNGAAAGECVRGARFGKLFSAFLPIFKDSDFARQAGVV
jgi:hypothetical protein